MGAGRGCRAIFVDAGYVLTAGAMLVKPTLRRDDVVCGYRELVAGLGSWADEHGPEFAHLRTYWYDGTVEGRPAVDHNYLAALPYVSVRLGRVSSAGIQKGVDTLIVMDLLALAYRSRISRAYVVSGDEDLREAVLETERLGVQVVLVTVPAPMGSNNSAHLVRAADEAITLPVSFWTPYFKRPVDSDVPSDNRAAQVREQADRYAARLAGSMSSAELMALADGFPDLPRKISGDLMAWAEQHVGSLRRRPDLQSELRGQFWLSLRHANSQLTEPADG